MTSQGCIYVLCGKRYTITKSLKIHEKKTVRDTTGENWYSCHECGKLFLFSSGLFYHVNVHRRRYKCTECISCFGNARNLAVHSRSHSGEKPFECSFCSRQFTTSRCLVVHSRIHSGEKLYTCHLSSDLAEHSEIQSLENSYSCWL